jgi:5-methylcytosine-specific restriction protein A
MAYAAPSNCAEPGCPTLVHGGGSRCPEHKRTDVRDRSRLRYRSTNQAKRVHDQFYKTPAWRHLSDWHRKQHPLCFRCLEKNLYVTANVTDHIIERVDDRSRELDPENLMSLCHACHGIKTAEAAAHRRQSPKL